MIKTKRHTHLSHQIYDDNVLSLIYISNKNNDENHVNQKQSEQ